MLGRFVLPLRVGTWQGPLTTSPPSPDPTVDGGHTFLTGRREGPGCSIDSDDPGPLSTILPCPLPFSMVRPVFVIPGPGGIRYTFNPPSLYFHRVVLLYLLHL